MGLVETEAAKEAEDTPKCEKLRLEYISYGHINHISSSQAPVQLITKNLLLGK